MFPTVETVEAPASDNLAPGERELRNHPTQSVAAIDGWKSALMGLPFVVAGVAIELVALGVLHPVKHAPDWLIGIIGGMFSAAGIFLVVHGLRGAARQTVCRREAARYPNQPWLYDFHWKKEGISFSAFGEMVKRLIAALVWTAFLTPFAWVGWNVKGAWLFLVAVAFFGLVSLIFWYRWAAMLLDLLRYGNSLLFYDAFPFFLGSSLRARLRVPRHLSLIDQMEITFRCVEERYETRGRGRDRSKVVVCYEKYTQTVTLRREQLAAFDSGGIPVDLPIPEDQPGTSLSATPPRYWELEVKGKARGADYEAIFLVPVYKAS